MSIEVVKTHRKILFQYPGVVSVGWGFRYKNGVKTLEQCLVVGVEVKKPLILLKSIDILPREIGGYRVDVIQSGKVRVIAADPTQRFRPCVGGISIGHKSITAGTLGAIVKKNGQNMILSNNHVLAASNAGKIGDEILQPGPYDNGTIENDIAATLAEFVEIVFTGGQIPIPDCLFARLYQNVGNTIAETVGSRYRIQIIKTQPEATYNKVDCALATPIVDVSNEILEIGTVAGSRMAVLGESAEKFGRTTSHTYGTIDQIGVTVQVGYSETETAIFEDQLVLGPMSSGGDSGSLIVSSTDKQAIGLLFAGSDQLTIANSILNVIEALAIEF